jgi:hypothetical protein
MYEYARLELDPRFVWTWICLDLNLYSMVWPQRNHQTILHTAYYFILFTLLYHVTGNAADK